MDPTNDEAVSIFYTQLGGRQLEAAEDSAAAVARSAQALGPWLNPFMCPVIRSGRTLPPATSVSNAYVIAAGNSCWDSPPWSPVGGMYDSRQTYLVNFQPASAAAPLFTCCQQSGNAACPAAYVRCGGVWSATLTADSAVGSMSHSGGGGVGQPAVLPSATSTPGASPSAAPSSGGGPFGAGNAAAGAAPSPMSDPAVSAVVYLIVALVVVALVGFVGVGAWYHGRAFAERKALDAGGVVRSNPLSSTAGAAEPRARSQGFSEECEGRSRSHGFSECESEEQGRERSGAVCESA